MVKAKYYQVRAGLLGGKKLKPLKDAVFRDGLLSSRMLFDTLEVEPESSEAGKLEDLDMGDVVAEQQPSGKRFLLKTRPYRSGILDNFGLPELSDTDLELINSSIQKQVDRNAGWSIFLAPSLAYAKELGLDVPDYSVEAREVICEQNDVCRQSFDYGAQLSDNLVCMQDLGLDVDAERDLDYFGVSFGNAVNFNTPLAEAKLSVSLPKLLLPGPFEFDVERLLRGTRFFKRKAFHEPELNWGAPLVEMHSCLMELGVRSGFDEHDLSAIHNTLGFLREKGDGYGVLNIHTHMGRINEFSRNK